MAKPSKETKAPQLVAELDPQTWARFEENVRKVAKAGPAHREAAKAAPLKKIKTKT